MSEVKQEVKIIQIIGMPGEFTRDLWEIRDKYKVVEEIKSTQVIEIPRPAIFGIESKTTDKAILCSAIVYCIEKPNADPVN